MSCGVGLGAVDLALLWLWHKPAAVAPIRPLAWEPPYAAGAAQETAKRQKKKKKKKKKAKTKTKTKQNMSPQCPYLCLWDLGPPQTILSPFPKIRQIINIYPPKIEKERIPTGGPSCFQDGGPHWAKA